MFKLLCLYYFFYPKGLMLNFQQESHQQLAEDVRLLQRQVQNQMNEIALLRGQLSDLNAKLDGLIMSLMQRGSVVVPAKAPPTRPQNTPYTVNA